MMKNIVVNQSYADTDNNPHMSFWDRFNDGLAMRGKNVAFIARKLEISTAAIYKWKGAPDCPLYATTLIRLSAVLELNPIWLATGTGLPTPSASCLEAKELCEIYDTLPGQSKSALLTMARALLSNLPTPPASNNSTDKSLN